MIDLDDDDGDQALQPVSLGGMMLDIPIALVDPRVGCTPD